MKKSIFFFYGSLFLISSNALACKCVPTTPQESYQRATIVFRGKLVSKPLQFMQQGKTLFKVTEIWKGMESFKFISKGKDLIELDRHFKTSCSFYFEQGKEYIVYARNNKEGLESNLCSSTSRIDNAQDSLKFLKAFPSHRLESQN